MSDTPIHDQLVEELGDPQNHIDEFDRILRAADKLIVTTLYGERCDHGTPVDQSCLECNENLVLIPEETLEVKPEDF